MSEQKQASHESDNRVLDQLLLPLGSAAMPFELLGVERQFRSADWAWLFLSLSPEYRDAYAAHANDKDDPNLRSYLDGPDNGEIKPDRDGSCGTHFGLAAWLNPSATELPKLKKPEDSWFFPLMRPITEDYQRREFPSEKFVRAGPLHSSQLGKYDHFLANETPFGYRPPLGQPRDQQCANATWGIIWVAIDCSVPPNGQVFALQTLAIANRENLMGNGWRTNDDVDEATVEDITESSVFEHLRISTAAGTTDKVANLSVVWRSVRIDALGPIVSQIKVLLRTLTDVHRSLVVQGLGKPQPFRRFKNSLTPSKDRKDGEFLQGGSYLKALFVIAELMQWNYDDKKIAQLTGIVDKNDQHRNKWRQQFDENITGYMIEAKNMVDYGYRSLIHLQKPNPPNVSPKPECD